MALTKCNECKREVSTSAKTCPGCGAKVPKQTSLISIIVAGLFAVFIGKEIFSSNDRPAAPPPTPEQVAAKARHEAAFQKTAAVARTLKASLRDPDSLQWESIRANDDASTICIEYRARNGFGGMNREFVVVHGGKATQKTADWNKHCTQALTDMKSVRHAL